MSSEVWRTGQIEVDVSGAFTTHHHFLSEAGELGELTIPAFSQQGIYQSAGSRKVLMRKTSWLGSGFELLEGDTVCGHAERRGLFSPDILVQFAEQEYVLEPEGLFSRGWYLVDTQGARKLEVRPRGVLRQGAYLTIQGAIDSDLAVFAYYLVQMRQQEDAAAAAAVSGAAAS
jgi:hypothetical protein